jgi:TIR domain
MASASVFISYSSRDRRDAFAIKQLLESHRMDVWLDFFDIQAAVELRQQLVNRVRQAGVFCLLLSPSAVESRWVGEEIATALAARTDGLRVLPIILRPCRIPAALDNIVGFDASDGLDKEAVRLRLVRAACGEAAVDEGVLLDAANRMLLANTETVQRAEAELPGVAEQIAPLAGQAIRNVSLAIRPETLPEDPNVILELQLEVDRLFSGTMSFYIARYREGRTWPEEFGFREPPFGEFFLTDRPRLDVQFKWFDRVVAPSVDRDGTDLKTLPATYRMEFDGASFKPKGELNLPQVFEIPSLDALEKKRSRFRLIAHDTAARNAYEIASDTDIDIRLTAQAGQGGLCLYASRTTPQQRVVVRSEYLSRVAHPIRKTALLQRYVGEPAYEDRRLEIIAALEKGEFDSDDQRRLAAQFRFSEAIQARFKTLHRDAYAKFQEAAELLQPLVLEKAPDLEDAVLMYRACRALVDTWLRQNSVPQAGELAKTLGLVAQAIMDSDPTNTDFQGIWADAVLMSADIHARLGDTWRAAGELHENVDVRDRLYRASPSAERRLDYLQALTDGVRNAMNWGIADAVPVEQWKEAIKAEAGDSAAELLTTPQPEGALPRWLEKHDPAGWPTVPLKSATLRYSLRIPKRWKSEPAVRGTSLELEHVYSGTRDTEWLNVSFMDNANDAADMTNWVEALIAMTGFPVLLKLDPLPQLVRWTYLGKLSGLAEMLRVDEAHAYTGLAKYAEQSHEVLGRIYVVMARRKTFAWKLALSIETACFDGMPEEKVYSQDHVRAGAVFGTLQLGD